MYHTSSLVVPDGGSGGPSKEDGLKTGSGSGGSKDLELSGGKGIGTAVNSGFGSGGSSEFDGLRSGSGSGGGGSGSDSGGGAGGVIFLKSAREGEGAIGCDGAGLRSGDRLLGGSARGLIRDGAGSKCQFSASIST